MKANRAMVLAFGGLLPAMALALAVVRGDGGSESLVAADDCPASLGDCSGVDTTVPDTGTVTTLSATTTSVPGGTVYTKESGTLRVEVRLDPPAPPAGAILRFHVKATDIPRAWLVGGADYGDGSEGSFPRPPHLECADVPTTTAPLPPTERIWTREYSYRLPGRYLLHVGIASADCDTGEDREVEVTVPVEVVAGELLGNGPRSPTLTLTQLQPIAGEDPASVVVNVEGTDEDGWVRRITLDWGDNSTPWVLDRPLSSCTDPVKHFPISDITRAEPHRYGSSGPFEVRAIVESVACDGSQAQTVTQSLIVQAP